MSAGIEVPTKFDRTSQLPASACPTCGKVLDAATGDAPKPSPGDFTICLCCAEPALFDDDLALGAPTGEEVEEFYAVPELARMQALAARRVRDQTP
ncbi:MAG: hypothetical protein OXH38_11750 [Chloroflexi bacterium]|nr:hypothetical protein [Chloroflexota bacterium]